MSDKSGLAERFEQQIGSLIERERLIPPGALVLAAVSGGPDSMAMLVALGRLGRRVCAAHVNHGLRAEARSEADFVASFCAANGIALRSGEIDVGAERRRAGGGVQEVARALRYAFLEECADEAGADVIATAHTQNDQVETVLMHVFRGSGIDGLAGIPYRRGRIVRPLLETSRADIEAYLALHGITACRDASNSSPAYARNRLRGRILPLIREQIGAAADGAVLRLSKIARDESAYLDSKARNWLASHDGSEELFVPAISALHPALQRRVLRLWIARASALNDIGFAHMEQIRESLGTAFAVTLPGNIRVSGSEQALTAAAQRRSAERGRALCPAPLSVPGVAVFAEWTVRATGALPTGRTAEVRTLRPGDRIQCPFGRKKLSDLFGASRMPIAERWSVPLLVDAASQDVLAIANGAVSTHAPTLRFEAQRIVRDAATAD